MEPSSRVGDGFVIVSHAQLAPCPDNLHVVSHSSCSSAMCTYGSLSALNPHSDLSSRSVRADSIHVSMLFAHCGRTDGTRKYDRPQSRPQSRPYRTDGTRTAVFDRGSTHVPRCVIVVNGAPPVRSHLSVHGDCRLSAWLVLMWIVVALVCLGVRESSSSARRVEQ